MPPKAIATKETKAQRERRLWIEERATYLGATEVAAIVDPEYPYDSPHSVWLRKKGLEPEKPATIPMEVGIHLEPFIARKYAELTQNRVVKSKLYRHEKYPFLACNPDREVSARHGGHRFSGLLECKSVGHWASKNFGQDGSDQIPKHYLIQILWQLTITRRDFVHLAALIDNRDLRVFTYTLKPELSEIAHVFPKEDAVKLFNIARNWWCRYVEGDEEPPMSGKGIDGEWLKGQRATYENGQLTNTDEQCDAWCLELEHVRNARIGAEIVEAELENRIKRFMIDAGASELESTAGTFTLRTNVNGTPVFNTPFRSNKS